MSTIYHPARSANPVDRFAAQPNEPAPRVDSRYSGSAELCAAIRAAASIAPEVAPWVEFPLRYGAAPMSRYPFAIPAELEPPGPFLPMPYDARVTFHYSGIGGARGSLTCENTAPSLRRLADRVHAARAAFDGKVRSGARRPAAPASSAAHVTARAMLKDGDRAGALQVAESQRGAILFGSGGSAGPILYMQSEPIEIGGHALAIARQVMSGKFLVMHCGVGLSISPPPSLETYPVGWNGRGFHTARAAFSWCEAFFEDPAALEKLNLAVVRAAPFDQSAARLEFLGAAADAAPAESDAAPVADAAPISANDPPADPDPGPGPAALGASAPSRQIEPRYYGEPRPSVYRTHCYTAGIFGRIICGVPLNPPADAIAAAWPDGVRLRRSRNESGLNAESRAWRDRLAAAVRADRAEHRRSVGRILDAARAYQAGPDPAAPGYAIQTPPATQSAAPIPEDPGAAWRARFANWKAYAAAIDARAKAITDRRHARGWSIAASVGIPRNGCALHNASIDDDLSGWCKDNPGRLAAAKLARRYVDDWRASAAADRMTARAWDALNSGAPIQTANDRPQRAAAGPDPAEVSRLASVADRETLQRAADGMRRAADHARSLPEGYGIPDGAAIAERRAAEYDAAAELAPAAPLGADSGPLGADSGAPAAPPGADSGPSFTAEQFALYGRMRRIHDRIHATRASSATAYGRQRVATLNRLRSAMGSNPARLAFDRARNDGAHVDEWRALRAIRSRASTLSARGVAHYANFARDPETLAAITRTCDSLAQRGELTAWDIGADVPGRPDLSIARGWSASIRKRAPLDVQSAAEIACARESARLVADAAQIDADPGAVTWQSVRAEGMRQRAHAIAALGARLATMRAAAGPPVRILLHDPRARIPASFAPGYMLRA